jgi:hypothetical protein
MQETLQRWEHHSMHWRPPFNAEYRLHIDAPLFRGHQNSPCIFNYLPYTIGQMPETDVETAPITTEQSTEPIPFPAPTEYSQSESAPSAPFTTEESKLKATRDQFKKRSMKGGKGGNADTDTGMSTAVVRPEKPLPIPQPKFTVFKRDAPNPAQDSKRFYDYWNQLPNWAKDRTILYVYRDWPMLKPLAEDAEEFVYIDKISGSEPLQDDEDLLNRYGSGSYKLMFNEQRNICAIYVPGLGIHDLKSHPPVDRRISDVTQVDLDFPGNKSYVEFLRMTGKLPEQTKGKEAEAEMAVTALVDRLQDRNEKLQDKALEMATKAGAKPSVEPTQEAINRAIGVVADAATRSNEMLSEAYQTIKATKEEGSNSTTEVLKLAFELAEKLGRKGSSGDDEIRELRAELARVNNDRLAALEKQIAEARTAPVTSGSPFANIKEGFSAIKEMRDLVEDISGGKPNPAEELAGAAGAPAWLMPAIQYGLPLLGNIVQAIMVGRGLATPGPTQQPGPSPVPMPMPQANPGQPRPQPQPMPIAPGIPAPQAPPMPAPAAAPIPIQGQSRYGLPADVEDLLYEIKTPFTHYISSGDLTGGDYADVFIANYGEQIFKQLTSFGVEGVAGAIMAFPPIVDRLTALGITEVRLKQFVGEFVVFKPEDPMDDGGEDEPVLPEGGGDGGGSVA